MSNPYYFFRFFTWKKIFKKRDGSILTKHKPQLIQITKFSHNYNKYLIDEKKSSSRSYVDLTSASPSISSHSFSDIVSRLLKLLLKYLENISTSPYLYLSRFVSDLSMGDLRESCGNWRCSFMKMFLQAYLKGFIDLHG